MTHPVRLTVVLTHPIQYYAPWFRHIHEHAPEIALTVVYAARPTPQQQGVGFDRAFEWDVPLTAGYRSIVVRDAARGERIDSDSFSGLDVAEIGDAIGSTKPDVVVITGWYSKTLVRALVACRRLGVPTLYRGDSHLDSAPPGWRRPLWSLKTWWLLRMFDGYLSPGARVDRYLRRFGVPDHRVFRVPHGVDNEMFARTAAPYQVRDARAAARREIGVEADVFAVLFVGKIVERKRPLDLVRAVARLDAPTAIVVAGAGPLEPALRAEAARLGVDLRILGFLNQTELGRAYAIADCLALPSDHSETWGLVVNEALATGLPVVVSDAVGCAPDLVRDGETGRRHPLGDVSGLADALDAIRRAQAAGHDFAPVCRAAIGDSDFAAMTTSLVRAARSVIPHSPRPEPEWASARQRVVACCGGMVIAGGLERITFEVLRVLRERGAATHAIVNGWENFRITPLAESSGATWSVGPYRYPLRRRNLTPAIVAGMIVEMARVSSDLLRVARRVKPTHVLLPEFHAVLRNAPALWWLRLRGVRTIARLGNAPLRGTFYRLLWRFAIDPFVDHYVANSNYTRDELLAHGIRSDKVRTIVNMAPRRTAAWDPDASRVPGRLIFVGQIIPEKGLDLLLDALAIVRGRGIDATLDVVGDIDGWEAPANRGHRAALRARAGRADLDGAVTFLGYREDVPQLMSRASLHCCPSRPEQREAFGNVVVEAKASGVPSIVTPSGDLPDLVTHKVDGWVCDAADARSIADGIEYFFGRADALAAAGRAALASSAAFGEDRFASAWAAVFVTQELEHSNALC